MRDSLLQETQISILFCVSAVSESMLGVRSS